MFQEENERENKLKLVYREKNILKLDQSQQSGHIIIFFSHGK